MNLRLNHLKDRWKRTPKGFRWLILGVGTVTTLYVVEDLWGRAAWRNYHREWAERGVKITRFDPARMEVPQETDFWESEVMRKWEANSPDYDPSIPDIFSGDYRTSEIVLTRASLSSSTLTVFSPAPSEDVEACLGRARNEDLAHDNLFQAFADGCARPRARSFGDQVPNLGRINDAARHACDRIAVHLHSDDPERACRDQVAFIQFANHLQEQGLVGLLVDVAVCGIISDTIWEGLAMQAFDEGQLLKLQTALEETRLTRDFAQVALREMGWSRDVIDDPDFRKLLFTELNVAFSGASSDPLRKLQNAIRYGLDVVAPKGRHMNAVLDNFSMWESVILENGQVPMELTVEQVDRMNAWKPGWRSRISIMRVAIPNLGRIGDATLEVQQKFDFGIIACALERYQIANGSYPETLEALVPDFISDLPGDRFQFSHPIRYATKEGPIPTSHLRFRPERQ